MRSKFEKKKKNRQLKAKKKPFRHCNSRPNCSKWQHFLGNICSPTRQRVKRHDGSVPSEPLLRCRLSAFIPLFVTLKSRCLTYKLIYKLHFSMNPFHCGCGPSTLSSGPRIHLQMKPRRSAALPHRETGCLPIVHAAWERRGWSAQPGPAHLAPLKADPV